VNGTVDRGLGGVSGRSRGEAALSRPFVFIDQVPDLPGGRWNSVVIEPLFFATWTPLLTPLNNMARVVCSSCERTLSDSQLKEGQVLSLIVR
jgi:hypothetical protein